MFRVYNWEFLRLIRAISCCTSRFAGPRICSEQLQEEISGTQAISLIHVALAAGNSDPNIVIIVDVWQMILIRMPGHLYWACICLQKIQGGSIGFVMSAPWYEPLEDSLEDRSAVDRILSFNHRWWVRSSILYDFTIPAPTVPLSVCLKLKNKESLLIM